MRLGKVCACGKRLGQHNKSGLCRSCWAKHNLKLMNAKRDAS
jgi:hypothetical protein